MKELKFRYKTLLFGLGIAFLLFSLARMLFFVFNYDAFISYSFFEISNAFFVGIWFDVVPVFYYNLIFILLLIIPIYLFKNQCFKFFLSAIFITTNGIALFQNLIDIGYFPFNKKRTGAEIFLLSKEWNKDQIIQYATDFWYLILIFIIIIAALIYVTSQLNKKKTPNLKSCFFFKITNRIQSLIHYTHNNHTTNWITRRLWADSTSYF